MPAINAATPATADTVNGPRSHGQPAVGSHRERDHDYRAIVAELDDITRVVECVDGLQWILQRRRGDRWFGIAFCRMRDPLIREATKALGGAVPGALFALPSRLDGQDDNRARCHIRGGLRGKLSRDPNERHMFCLADRKPGATPASVLALMPARVAPMPAMEAPTVEDHCVDVELISDPHGPTPGALQGDDYPLEYYDNGYPKLPSC